ncbi:MAG: hypothetical protein M5U13_10225 [Thermoanaerobaculia bacterium]|nr:hypothetical protein [Thermoanaerobaculia bacterium]
MAPFVTFEGLDGSGKSTHLRRIAAELARRGVALVCTHEPGGTPSARRSGACSRSAATPPPMAWSSSCSSSPAGDSTWPR